MSEPELEALQVQLSKIRNNTPSGRRYPKDLRHAVQGYARRRLAAGAGVEEVCRNLGLSWGTLHRWLREPLEAAPGKEAMLFRPVVVARARWCSPMSSGSFSLSSPRGHRVDGLGLEHLVYLLRELG